LGERQKSRKKKGGGGKKAGEGSKKKAGRTFMGGEKKKRTLIHCVCPKDFQKKTEKLKKGKEQKEKNQVLGRGGGWKK